MGVPRRSGGERREPRFDATPIPGGELRLSEDDRVGGPRQEAPKAQRAGAKSRSPKAANDDSGRKPSGGRSSRKGGRGGGKDRGFFRGLFYWAAVLCLWVGIGGVGLLIYVAAHLPPVQSLAVPKRPPTVQIVSADGASLATRGEMGGASVPLADMPKYLPQAFLAIEDRRFYSHFGVDIVGVARAVFANVTRRGVSQGGSTITQQLAKNVFLTQERTLHRKLQEVMLAFWLEHKFTKAQILELYINRVYFGAGAYGIEAAAQRYFGKSARQVTLAESAMLAGLVKSPSRLAPTRNLEGARKRAQLVLAAMQDAGFVPSEMTKTATAHPAQVARSGAGAAAYVADWVMDVLDDLVGRFDEDLIVETTVQASLQTAAEAAIVEEIAQKGEKLNVGQGALVAMTPSGAIRALVGGRNYAESQFNRAIAAKRQPGSSFKPFVYLAALEHGLTPDTLREDRPINIRGWQPENYTREYFGAVSLQRALAMSLNTVAVRLTLEMTPKTVAQTAHRLGIASELKPNASLALGTSEVSVLEMVTAFAPFANGGIATTPYIVTRVRTAGGKVLYRHGDDSLGRIVDPRIVGMMNTMLHETLVSGTARKAELPGWTAAGKTGTTQDFRDAWFVGHTAHLVTAVWLGNDDSSPMRKVTGGGLPSEIWSRFMKVAHQGVPPVDLPGVVGRPPVQSPVPGGGPAVASARPPAPVHADPRIPIDARRPPQRQSEPRTLDRWFMDTVFGRR